MKKLNRTKQGKFTIEESNTLEELNFLLTRANKVQLNLISNIIKSILELTSIK